MTTYTNSPWWDRTNRDDVHVRLVPLMRSMRLTQETRYANFRKLEAIYEYGYGASDYGLGVSSSDAPIDDRRLFFNASQNATDTIVAHVSTPKVIPMAFTEGGTYDARRKAKDLSALIEGQWDESRVDAIKEDVIRDAAIYSAGIVKVFPSRDYDAVAIERVLPYDVTVDEAEARYRKPRCMYHTQRVDRWVTLAEYGEPDRDLHGSAERRATAIKRAPNATHDDIGTSMTDTIELFEAWHLPSRSGGKDGRHSICVEGATLLDEPWEENRFPFCVYIPRKKRRGWWGLSTMRQLAAGQREFEKLSDKLQRAHRRMGGSHILANRQANVNTREITNGQGSIIEYEGPLAPQEWTPSPANPQTYQYFQMIPQMMLKFIGVGEMAAQSAVPAGLQNASGKALQVFKDEGAKYFVEWFRELDRWAEDIVDAMKLVARKCIEENPGFSVRYREKRGYRTLKWKDMVDTEHVVRVVSINQLSQDPAAKFAQLDAMLSSGAITPEIWRRLSGLPDIEAENDVDLADQEIIDRNLDYMVRMQKYVSPESFDNLQLIIQRGGKFYNACRIQEVPDERLELIRQYIADAQSLLAPPAPAAGTGGPLPGAPQGEQPMPPGMGPPGMPEAMGAPDAMMPMAS